MSVRRRTLLLPLLGALAALTLSACGTPGTSARADDGKGPLAVVASFYPLQFVAERIGGHDVAVTSLTKPGAEPHDLELTPKDVAHLADADLAVYLAGFQPAVDDAVSIAAPRAVFDARPAADLDLTYTPIEEGRSQGRQAASTDPHFWLDPTKLRAVAAALAARLEQLDPVHAADYRTNLAALQDDLERLDREFQDGLSRCATRELVTSHNAFGYLAERYGLTQVGISGLVPEAEPDPKSLADVARFVRDHHVRTIYYETLVSPAVARTVADETGVRTAVLDPLEGLNDASQGHDYLEVMRSNLENLRQGQPCR